MKISLNQLKQYVEINVPPVELCDRMVMAGFEVEEAIDTSTTMRNIVVGKITDIQKHEDSDHLQICQIDVGTGTDVQIVTGAQNVFVGAYVPAALHDSLLPNGTHIKKGKLRGVESNGMLCSGEELGLKEEDYEGAGVYGIMILKGEPKPGTDMRELLHLNDWIIDFKITANRPDCQSVLGVAREIGVVLNTKFKGPNTAFHTTAEKIEDYISVEVQNHQLCPRYMGRFVKNLRIKPSPEWMRESLKAAGMRPINNIVDITNFVMLETGQPMHAFDYDQLQNKKVIVRNANAGETITTLDEKTHQLTPEMLVIADGEKPSCLAGIMGGLESEITQNTKNLFLESANFKRDNVRRTARALGVRTESSGRFERGIDIMNTEYAMNRALALIEELDAGDIVDGVIDLNEGLPAPRSLTVSVADINALLGVEIDGETMCNILNALQIETVLKDGKLHSNIPSFRGDIEYMADIAEEVMRIYGYDHIHGTVMNGTVLRGTVTKDRALDDQIKALLCSNGLNEITTYSFIGSKDINLLNLPAEDIRHKAVTILNPLGDEFSTMRTQLITSMLEVMGTNISRKNADGRFFEISKRFMPKQLPLTEQPEELKTLSIGLYGDRENFFTLKGLIEQLAEKMGVEFEYARTDEAYLHPGRRAEATLNGQKIAVFGELHPEVAAKVGINQRVYVAEVYINLLVDLQKELTVYSPLPKFPAVNRDLALMCDKELPIGEMTAAIRSAGGKLLENIALFDVYEGEQIPSGKKSVAFNLTLRSKEETLTDDIVEKCIAKVIKKLEAIGAELRH